MDNEKIEYIELELELFTFIGRDVITDSGCPCDNCPEFSDDGDGDMSG